MLCKFFGKENRVPRLDPLFEIASFCMSIKHGFQFSSVGINIAMPYLK